MVGTAEHPLTIAWDEHRGWRGDWLGRLWQWLTQHDLTVSGGDTLSAACTHDVALMCLPMTAAERGLLSMACFDKEVYMLSDVIMPDGSTLRPKLRQRGTWTTATTATAALSKVLIRECFAQDSQLR